MVGVNDDLGFRIYDFKFRIYDLGLKRIHLFKVMNEGIELPGTRGGVRLAVGGDVFCGLEIGFQLGFVIGRGQEFELGVGILEGSGVPLLARRLIFLVVFLACTVKLLAVSHVKIATIKAVSLAVDLFDAG